MEKFWERKCSFNTYVHNVQLNWVNQESRDLRWRCGCLFLRIFVGASRSYLCARSIVRCWSHPGAAEVTVQRPNVDRSSPLTDRRPAHTGHSPCTTL